MMNPDLTVGACEQRPPMGQVMQAKPSITRQRYAELVQLGLKASQELEMHGLQRSEYCEFGRIMERIMQL